MPIDWFRAAFEIIHKVVDIDAVHGAISIDIGFRVKTVYIQRRRRSSLEKSNKIYNIDTVCGPRMVDIANNILNWPAHADIE